MIHEVDDAIRSLIQRHALAGPDVEVVFDAPTREWSSRRNAPTIDAYLYDIREDLRRREVGRTDERDGDGRVVSRTGPPRWYKLSYLLTAWTQRPEDEHRLLAALLRAFLLYDHLPTSVLTGSLADAEQTVPYTCALPPPEDRALSDVWSALGGELKPSLDLVITAPFHLGREIEFGPPVLEGPRLNIAGAPAPKTRRRRAGAAEADAPPPQPARKPAAEERIGSRVGDPGRRLRITELGS